MRHHVEPDCGRAGPGHLRKPSANRQSKESGVVLAKAPTLKPTAAGLPAGLSVASALRACDGGWPVGEAVGHGGPASPNSPSSPFPWNTFQCKLSQYSWITLSTLEGPGEGPWPTSRRGAHASPHPRLPCSRCTLRPDSRLPRPKPFPPRLRCFLWSLRPAWK